MEFEIPEEVRLICGQIDQFIEQEVVPLEREYDQFVGEDSEANRLDDEGRFVDEFLEVRSEIRKRSAEAGFYTMNMPERVGGGGLSHLEYSIVMEHLFNRNPEGLHELMIDPISVTPSLMPLAEDEAMTEKYLEPVMNAERHMAFGLTEPDHGSDPTWMDTSAEKDGDEWVINGRKCFIGNGPYADFIMVHARTSGEDGDAKGISTFLVDDDNPGWTKGKVHRPMGDRGEQGMNDFDDCRVPEEQMVGDEGEGFMTAMDWVGGARLHIPAKAVGLSEWMLEASIEYAETRKTFGQEIGTRERVQDLLVEMRVDIEMARWLYRYAAWKLDNDQRARWELSAAKLKGSQLQCNVADNAIQIHGGAGYMSSLPFEELYRNGRGSRIYEGTDEIQRQTIAKELLNL